MASSNTNVGRGRAAIKSAGTRSPAYSSDVNLVCMATLGLIEYDAASPEVRAVYDDIMATRKTDWINNFWKAIANDPARCGARGRASRRSWGRARSIR